MKERYPQPSIGCRELLYYYRVDYSSKIILKETDSQDLINFVVGAGKVILESAILTTVVVLSLTLYTFWAAKKGYDFNFLGPFLFGAIIVLMVFAFIQVNTRPNYLLQLLLLANIEI